MSNTLQKNPEVLMTLGGGHNIVAGEYFASEATSNRAIAAARYYDQFPEQPTTYLFSGFYGAVASRGQIQAPSPDRAEAVLAEQIFKGQIEGVTLIDRVYSDKWRPSHLTGPQTVIEDKSVDTYTNFIDSIEKGCLKIGQFDSDFPLLLSTEREHAWRAGVIATQALALPDNSLLRLPVENVHQGVMLSARERLLLAITRLTLADIGEVGGAEPGNLEHTREASRAFIAFSNQPAKAVRAALKHPSLWAVPRIATIQYPSRPLP